jgi:hypothetical protein
MHNCQNDLNVFIESSVIIVVVFIIEASLMIVIYNRNMFIVQASVNY